METRELIIKTFEKNEALKASQVAEITGLDKKIVDKEIEKLKKENLIVSPKKCFWTVNK